MLLLAPLALGACGTGSKMPLPDGTYRYQSREPKVVINSIVTVSRSADVIVAREDARFDNLNASTTIETRLDPKTFAVVAFTVQNDPEGMNSSMAITRTGATYRLSGAPALVEAPRVAGAPALVFSDWVSSYAVVPALVHTTGARTLNAYHPDIIHGKAFVSAFWVVGATESRPDGAPASDASLALALARAKKPILTFWYDPSTFVLDVVEIGNDPMFVRTP